MSDNGYAPWSEEHAVNGVLSFDTADVTVAQAVLDDDFDPIALGPSGTGRSCESSVLTLAQHAVSGRSALTQTSLLVIPTQPWSYNPAVGRKESVFR